MVNLSVITLIVINLVALSLQTESSLAQDHDTHFQRLEYFSVAFFTIEYLLRVWSIQEGNKYKSRLKYLTTSDSIIDLIAILPFYLSFFLGMDLRVLIAFRLLRLLKLIRYLSPLAVMASVLRAEARAFMSAMLVMLLLVFVSAAGIYFFERQAQPEALGSIPRAMWWTVVTLTTLGYGDVIPITTGGRIFTGLMTLLAIGIIALPAGMLASRFSEELHKRKKTYSEMVEKIAADGQIDQAEEQWLEKERVRLCLSKTDTSILRNQVLDQTQTTASSAEPLRCPHCNQRLTKT